MKPLNFMVLVAGIFLTACESKITPFPTLIRDRMAARLVKQQQVEPALEQYVKILEEAPAEPAVHSNIGVLLSQIQKPEEALKSYQLALELAEKNKDLAAQFAIHYNLGTYYGTAKKTEDALMHYQAALEIIPSSKETKSNIELLIQNQQGGGGGEDKKNQEQSDQQKKDGKDQENKDNKKDGDKDKDKDEKDKDGDKNKDQKEKPHDQGSQKYKPRPFKGDQLNEGDVKKILGELRSQEQKIRANFDKKERKESKNEKDW
ncbi:MAG: tetratricopeptide repeat protein [Bdellovibrionaceae bacterium]|nr:tetratricopeptide repeat protein [Bdellovibrio sp.]